MGIRDTGIDGEFLVTLRHGAIEKRAVVSHMNAVLEEFFFYITLSNAQEISIIEINVYNSTISAGTIKKPLFFDVF